MDIRSSVEIIKGVGKETAKKLEKLNVISVYDLLTFWPRRYEDYSTVQMIKDIKPGTVTVKARIESIKSKRVRRGLHITEAVIRDDSSAIRVVWFNQPYREKYFDHDKTYYFSGLYDFSFNRYVLQNPTVEAEKEFTTNTARIVPIYPQTKGLDSREIRRALSNITNQFGELAETLPSWLVTKYKLMPFSEAAYQLHWPENSEKLQMAQKRVGFEEVFSYVLAGQLIRHSIQNEVALKIQFNEVFAHDYTSALPFQLTDAQKVAAWEILQDIDNEQPMNRLLEGDVGSGKTAVAAFAAFVAAKQGIQTAFMAPTELLARQHAATIADLLEPLGVRICLLTSAVKKDKKDILKRELANGSVNIAVGTHALLQENVRFHRLGLVVIDEQHRFGVKQRQKLVDKALKMPHILSMTATPIPRSLALTVYGELDISIINQKPRNRLPIVTMIWSPNSRDQLYQTIDDQIKNGKQVFVVCPLIDETEGSDIKSVNKEIKRLKTGEFKHRRMAMLHGKMKDTEKAMIMQQFIDHEIDILVSTTVIEVGIDVPNATVMLIEGADTFGLAQLHQLRGRVGRGNDQGYCYLVPSTSQKPSQRLRAMETTNDGFKLAEMDLEIRGPGAIYGSKQHGALDLRIAQITDTTLIKSARTAAETFIEKQEQLDKYPVLASRIEKDLSLTYLN